MAELIRQLVVNELHPALRPLGFRRSDSTWNQRVGDFVQVINVQSSQYSKRGNEMCTVNVGVFSAKAYSVFWEKPAPRFAHEYDCVVRRRIGKLMEGGEDRWWTLSQPGDVKAVGEVLIRLLMSRGMPWLESIGSLQELHEALASEKVTHSIYLAIVKAEMGDRLGAAALLDEGKGQRWEEGAQRVREALHLDEVAVDR